jgi:methionyl-tRNA formyltransferase
MSLRIVFAGTPAFSVPCLQALMAMADVELAGVVSQPDRRAGRGMRLTPSPVKQAALDAGIDIITPERLRGDEAALHWLQDKRPDILVVVAFGMILPVSWLHTPAIAPVNVHASLLPRWRGAAPIERALLAGDAETGVCIMHMEEGLDTGGVYARRALPITGTTTGGELWAALSRLGGELLAESLPAIAAGGLAPVPQPDAGITYAAKIGPEDRQIDWAQGAHAVDRQVRCFSPKPGARTRLGERWLKVLSGRVLEGRSLLPAGSVVALTHGLDIACGEGIYRVETLQPEGKGAMAAIDFLRGAQLEPGHRFT